MDHQPVYIFGHKNPDADAMCSAIAYAEYKNAVHGGGYEAARCGNSNARIDTILHRFGLGLPVFIGDVTPRVRDIMVEEVRKAEVTATCADALEQFDRYDIRALPVVDDENRIQGVATIFQMGQFFLPRPNDVRSMRKVRSTISNILSALGGHALHLVAPDHTEDFYVRVGAMDLGSFGKFLSQEGTPPEQSVIVVGDRADIQRKSIEMGMRLLVVTGNLEVGQEIVDLARERGVSLVVSPFDSATTSWIIRMATSLEPLIDREFLGFDPDETLASVRRKVATNSSPVFFVTGPDRLLLGLFTKSDILKPVQKKIILVDHNEIGQAVNGADEVEILEIIDHHRLGNPPTQQPILFLNEPLGSTCTIVARQFKRHGITPPAPVAGVMMGGIISDTLLLNSPTTTETDREMLGWLEGVAGVMAESLASDIFSSGSIIIESTPDRVIESDCKVYEEDGVRFSASQVEELGFDNFWKNEAQLLEALEAYRNSETLYFSVLLVTDINTQNSLLAVQGDKAFIDLISYPHVLEDRIFEMPGIVSRKKQLIPYLISLLQGEH